MSVTDMFDNEFTNDEIIGLTVTFRDIARKIRMLDSAYFIDSPFTEDELMTITAFKDSFESAIVDEDAEEDDNVDIELD